MDLHWLVHFVRHVLRAQRAACQAPDDHVLKSRLARAVESTDQRDIPVDLDDEVFRILTVQATMPVQTAETVGLDAPQGPKPIVRAVRCLRRLLDGRVFFQGLGEPPRSHVPAPAWPAATGLGSRV